MYEDVKKIIDENTSKFLEELSDYYKLPKKDVLQKWEDYYNKKNIKKTGWQNFFAQRRLEIKKTNPELSFGELSKQISLEWSNLKSENKQKESDIKSSTIETNFTFEQLNEKKMKELKELCEKFNLKKSGNKTELIKNLLGQNKQTPKESPKPQKISLNDKNDTSLDIYIPSDKEKRSDFENESEILNNVEDDFDDFDDENSNLNSDSEETLDDEDDNFLED
jgi:hypothetical protein